MVAKLSTTISKIQNLPSSSNSEDITNREIFVMIILKDGLLIDEVYNDGILKIIKKPNQSGSINLLKELFHNKNISYDNSTFENLRILHKIRSTVNPVHSGETDFIKLLNKFDINIPVTDWAKVTEVCLDKFLESITDIKNNFQKLT
jgi:hypothetical protein